MTLRAFGALLLILLAACDRRADTGPVVVSMIGEPPRLRDPARRPLGEPDRALAAATAQGLVTFDAAGAIQQGLAARWIVIDGGRSYIFRLRGARWTDGRPVTAREIVAALKRQVRAGSRNPLAPWLTAVEDIVEMTPDVIEIDLTRPRPDLLALFAQPELAVVRPRGAIGAGPFRIVSAQAAGPLLSPVADPDRATDEQREVTPEDQVRLIGERAALAVARFAARRSDLVSGGTVAAWPIVQAADLPATTVRLDPAAGLFGFAVASRIGLLATAEGRAAVAEAIDRSALTAAFARQWAPTEQLLPAQLDSAAPPALAGWVASSIADRRADARAIVGAWRDANGGAAVTLRLALPAGSGGTLLWTRLATDLLAVGIRPQRVAPDAWDADLRLVDAVAPYDSARWYLATACAARCDPATAAAVEAARTAPTLAGRAAAIAAADAALAQDNGFIPLARPFRWSLVAPRLKAWQPNARAFHPLNQLRTDPTSTR